MTISTEQTPRCAVIGAGHAGVEAAFTLAAAGYPVDLWSDEPGELPYFRPRLIAVAFGQNKPEEIKIKPAEAYAKAGIALRHQSADALLPNPPTLNGTPYAGAILAQGAKPFIPPFAGEGAQRLLPLWTMADARAIRAKVAPGKRLTIIGGGVLGLESALRAAMAGLKVTLVEVAPLLANGVLGPGGNAVLKAALEAKGIALELGKKIQAIGTASLTLEDGTEIADDDFVLCSTGARPNPALPQAAGLPFDRGLLCAADLSLAPRLFSAGDVARPTAALPICAVRRAQLMGALAAKNLLRRLGGEPGAKTTPWQDPVLPLFMKVGDVEFHTLGEVRAQDAEERRIDDGSDPKIWKSVLYRGETPIGLRFVGTRAGFGEWEKQIAAARQ